MNSGVAAGICVGFAYGIVCRIIIAIIAWRVVPSCGITYSILPGMNAARVRRLRAEGLFLKIETGIVSDDSRLSDA